MGDADGAGSGIAARRAEGIADAGSEGCADETPDQDGAVETGDGPRRKHPKCA